MLKEFQREAISELERYFSAVAENIGGRSPGRDGWEAVHTGEYKRRQDGCERDVPTVCLKVPTGGGKTLLAIESLGVVSGKLLRERKGTGLVVWICPSEQIYSDTKRRLQTEGDLYRDTLREVTGAPGVDVWTKDDIARITPERLRSRLNVLLLMIQSAARLKNEGLKLFRDSGGNIAQHFGDDGDEEFHAKLLEATKNLDPIEGTGLVKTSVGNLIRMSRPIMILDEQHKYVTPNARDTIYGFNPAAVVEFSATPKDTNVLVHVTGSQLLEEHMIKLPINIASSSVTDWKIVLEQARLKRMELADAAERAFAESERYLRPICLVQVERTGSDQRDGVLVHALDVKDHLIERFGIPETAIAIKSSSTNDIENVDLLDEGCPIEWIITKQALQEGWDCPFAYILVTLNGAQSEVAMTQLVGRILRQPNQTPFNQPELNESYVFCREKSAEDISKEVKKALEHEGYEGGGSLVAMPPKKGASEKQTVTIRERFRDQYRDFDGTVYLPRFCVNDGKRIRPLDYYSDLLWDIDPSGFDFSQLAVELSADLKLAKEYFYRVTLGDHMMEVDESDSMIHETPEEVESWLVANLELSHFSQKQLRPAIRNALRYVQSANPDLGEELALLKTSLRSRILEIIQQQTDLLTEKKFRSLFEKKQLAFYLEKREGRFAIPKSVQMSMPVTPLTRANGQSLQTSLFDVVEQSTVNEFEKAVALFLDEHDEILWWYRNMDRGARFEVQGWKRNLIVPDFLAAKGDESYPGYVFVIESKGRHLKGNEDTEYKEQVAAIFSEVGKKVSWNDLGREFRDHQFRFQVIDQAKYDHNWRDSLESMVS